MYPYHLRLIDTYNLTVVKIQHMASEETKTQRRARLQRNYVAKHNKHKGTTHKSTKDYRRQHKHRHSAYVTGYGLQD